MRLKGHLLITLISLTALCSCIDEDTTECVLPKNGVVLTYDYLHNMSYSNLFERQVGKLRIFIFNESNLLCSSATFDNRAALTNQWSQQVELTPGTYTIVTWAGDEKASESFKIGHQNDPVDPNAEGVVVGTTELNELRAFLRCNIDPENDDQAIPQKSPINDLFHGIARSVVVAQGQMTPVNTSLIKNTNTLAIKIGKLSNFSAQPLTEANFKIQLTSRNGHYQYDNSINEYTRQLVYAPHKNCVEEDSLCYESKMLRLLTATDATEGSEALDARLMLNISYQVAGSSKVEVICENLDVAHLILSGKIKKRNAQGEIVLDADQKPIWVYPSKEYLDRQDRFEIVFSVGDGEEGEKGEITITVNGWTIINMKPDTPIN